MDTRVTNAKKKIKKEIGERKDIYIYVHKVGKFRSCFIRPPTQTHRGRSWIFSPKICINELIASWKEGGGFYFFSG